METELIRFVTLGWVLTHIILLYPLYQMRTNLVDRSKVLRIIGIAAAISVLGVLFINLDLSLRQLEIAMILALLSASTIVYVIPLLLSLIEIKRSNTPALRRDLTKKQLITILESFTKQVEVGSERLEFEAQIKPARWFEYQLRIEENQTDATQIVKSVIPIGVSDTYLRLLLIIQYYLLIQAVYQQSFDVPIPFVSITIDAELFYLVVSILLVIFLNYLKTTAYSLLDEFEEVQELVLMEMVKSLTGPDQERSEKSTLDAAKEKAKSIKEMRLKEELERKRTEMRQQVNSILGNDEKEQKEKFESELYNKQRLIRKVQKILNSTPIGKEIELQQIVEKVEADDPDMIESIIIGLISNNRVKGKYDIWERKFLVGDASSRFIEQTLESLKISPQNLEYIKLSKSGDVEIKFDNNGKLTALTLDEKTKDKQN